MIDFGARRRFGAVKMIATYGDGPISFLAHRYEMIEPHLSARELSAEIIKADLASFYYDLTTCMSDSNLAFILNITTPSQLLVGFDYPYTPAELIAPEICGFWGFKGFRSGERRNIMSRNGLRLIPRLTQFSVDETI